MNIPMQVTNKVVVCAGCMVVLTGRERRAL
jgi:hypothetical protein